MLLHKNVQKLKVSFVVNLLERVKFAVKCVAVCNYS